MDAIYCPISSPEGTDSKHVLRNAMEPMFGELAFRNRTRNTGQFDGVFVFL